MVESVTKSKAEFPKDAPWARLCVLGESAVIVIGLLTVPAAAEASPSP